MKFALTILGVNSATPAFGRFPTSQVLQIHNYYFLIDCGEGAQMRMSDFKIPRQKIDQIFISHLHGDHVFGLPGLLFSLDLMGRKTPLSIFSPPGLREMILAQLNPGGQLNFPLTFHEVDTSHPTLIFENQHLTVKTIPLKHRIPTVGFVFQEKPRQRNILPDKIDQYHLSIPQIKMAKAGKDVTLSDGSLLSNEELTVPPTPTRSFAYVSDTIFDETIIQAIRKVDLLYHETTFCEDLADHADLTMHSTARQAATIARKAEVGKLITGHYSSRYQDLQVFLDEAKVVFPATELGLEGQAYDVPFNK
jgi:ribonuclease Z